MFDLLVIGAGMGGLATAALAQRLGLRTGLLEAHTKLGGCAGYFQRGPSRLTLATALMGLRPGEPLHDLLDLLGVDFHAVANHPIGYICPIGRSTSFPKSTRSRSCRRNSYPATPARKWLRSSDSGDCRLPWATLYGARRQGFRGCPLEALPMRFMT